MTTTEADEPLERETILEVGAEGGSLTLYGARGPNSWRYFVRTVDHTAELLDEDEIRMESGAVDSWEAAFDRYPWHRLHPLTVHPEFREQVWAAVKARFGSYQEPARAGQLKLARIVRCCGGMMY